jgi:mRNA interferase MazF
MPLPFPPNRGEVLICDFQNYMPKGEMVKLRPIIVLSPSIAQRMDIVTVVALSTTQPLTILNYHLEITFDPPYSIKYPSKTMWLKGDMIYTMSLSRLSRPHSKNLSTGQRIYPKRFIDASVMKDVERCVLASLGIM